MAAAGDAAAAGEDETLRQRPTACESATEAARTGAPPAPYIPPSLLLQWHVTERCNLRCSHCYRDSEKAGELGLDELLGILAQYEELLADWRSQQEGDRPRGHITLTGGEPFLRPDFTELLDVVASKPGWFSFGILTNGTLVDAALAARLRTLGPRFVQVSIDGVPATHDAIRGAGSHREAVAGVRNLVRAGIRTLISFTAHRGNYREFPEVARLGRRLGVARVWADRLVPVGDGIALRHLSLTPDETREFVQLMARARGGRLARWLSRTEIAAHRALQFVAGGGRPYRCSAGDTLIALQPNGDVYPCRRMPVRAGNVLRTPLREVYDRSDLLVALRTRSEACTGCTSCAFARLCRGGLKCLAHALHGDPFAGDPGCWLRGEDPAHAIPGRALPRGPSAVHVQS